MRIGRPAIATVMLLAFLLSPGCSESDDVIAPPTGDPPCSSPDPNPDPGTDHPDRFADCENGTVTDTDTALIWLKDANCFELEDFAGASTAVAELRDGDCGLTDNSSPGDWRLPTTEEWDATLDRAVAKNCQNPSLTNTPGTGCYGAGPQPFTGVEADWFQVFLGAMLVVAVLINNWIRKRAAEARG